MPFDDTLDLNNDFSLSDLEKLDKQAEKTEKNLQRLRKKGGIFAQKRSNTPMASKSPVNFEASDSISKQDKLIEKNFEKLTKKIKRDTVKNFGKDKEGFAKQVFGDNVGKTLFSIGKNPTAFISNSIIGLTGIGFAKQIADVVIKEIQRLDKFFKVFVDRIDDRVDQLRNKQTQAEIAAGLTQVIITTSSGNVEARDSYNTFNEFNNNRAKLEEDFAIRNTSGYE